MFWSLLCGLAFLSLGFCRPLSETLDFVAIGDWGGLPSPPYSTDIERGISRRLMDIGNTIEIDFLLALGDNFYYDGVENEHDSRFQNSFESVFKASDLFFPWYFVAGNHDWHGNVSAQIAYSQYSTRWKFPDHFYSIEKMLPDSPDKKLAIIMIDTIQLCGLVSSDFDDDGTYRPVVDEYFTNKYWTFIKDELVRVRDYAYVIVAGHYPVWSVAEHGPTDCLVKKLDPLLKQFNVTAYFNGHDHTMEHIQVPYEGRLANYFTIGAANFFSNNKKNMNKIPPNSLKFHWKNHHALGALAYLSMTSKSLQVHFLSTNGETIYSTNIPPRY